MSKGFTVCIVGRPNVGKSTLFNKLTGTRNAIVDDMPGVTRDRIFGHANLDGVDAIVIDTGGFEPAENDHIMTQIKEQVRLAIEEADSICFVTDGRAGITTVEETIASLLRQSGKPVTVAVNKMDTAKIENLAADFYSLGFEKVIAVSAEHSVGLGELCEALGGNEPRDYGKKEDEETEAEEKKTEEPFTIAVVGMPNAGKSSLVNRLLGEERVMVSDVPGTTRDAIDTSLKYFGSTYTLIDTAGIRKRSRISRKLEKYSVVMAIKSVARAELAILVIDASRGISDQDTRIAGMIHEENRACVIVVNKWDIMEKDSSTMDSFTREIREKLKFISYAPIVFVSAKTGQRAGKILETVEAVRKEYIKRVSTGPLNRKLQYWISKKPPPIYRGHRPKIFYITQARTAPPTFSLVVSRPGSVVEPFRRYLANRIREEYGFVGAPVICHYRERKGRN